MADPFCSSFLLPMGKGKAAALFVFFKFFKDQIHFLDMTGSPLPRRDVSHIAPAMGGPLVDQGAVILNIVHISGAKPPAPKSQLMASYSYRYMVDPPCLRRISLVDGVSIAHFSFPLQQVGNTKFQQKTECRSTPFQGMFHYLAYSTALVSRMTLTLI